MKTINLDKFIKELGKSIDISATIKDIAILSADEFDKNFIRQSFFGEAWKPSKYVENENAKVGKSRKILIKSGALRRSIRYRIAGNSIIFGSALPYAEIHNTGGTINHPGGTAFFRKGDKTIWISNRKASGKNYPRTKPHLIKIPKRQFVGEHQQLDKLVEKEILNNLLNIF